LYVHSNPLLTINASAKLALLFLHSWPICLHIIYHHSGHASIRFHAAYTCTLREIRQVRSTRTRSKGSPRWFHPHNRWDRSQPIDRVCVYALVAFVPTAHSLDSFIVTISAFTQPGCKDASKDPHAKEKGKDFQKGLDGWCATKKAASVFLWLAFGV
jgi:hypothetical protein